MKKISVAIIMGSDSDLPVMAASTKVLDDMGIAYVINIGSAHRTPEHVTACVRAAEAAGAKVFIAAAGMSAALPGVVAATTTLPVIGVPMEGKVAGSLDALLSIAQMPPGIPVAAVAVGKAGATNAAVLAAEMIALAEPSIREKLAAYRASMAAAVIEKDRALAARGLAAVLKDMERK